MAHVLRLTAVGAGLIGDADNAKLVVRRVYEIFPEDEEAREIERALSAASGAR